MILEILIVFVFLVYIYNINTDRSFDFKYDEYNDIKKLKSTLCFYQNIWK